MDGYYEWRTTPDGKQPFLVQGDETLAAAGLWEIWKDPSTSERVDTFTIITTDSVPSLKELHDRMPVFLSPAKLAVWLDTETPTEVAQQLLLPTEGLRYQPISKRMNNSKNKAPEDAEPVED